MLKELAKILEDAIKAELLQQGHKASGELIDSVKVSSSEFEIIGESLFYGQYVERGRPAKIKRVPIDAILKWMDDKKFSFASDAEKRGVAFAIQYTIYNEGIPTKNSFKYSKNGRRKEYLTTVLNAKKETIRDYINKFIGDTFEVILKDYSKEVGTTTLTVY